MSATFYDKVKTYVLSKNESTNDITTDEADAILHFLLDLIAIKRETFSDFWIYTKKAVKLIQYCGASITSDTGFLQPCDVYESYTIAPDEIEYRIIIAPMIKIHKLNRHHMFHRIIYDFDFRQTRYFEDEIIDATITYDKRIHERECLNKLLKLYNVEHNVNNYVDTINKYLAELDDNTDINTPTKKRKI